MRYLNIIIILFLALSLVAISCSGPITTGQATEETLPAEEIDEAVTDSKQGPEENSVLDEVDKTETEQPKDETTVAESKEEFNDIMFFSPDVNFAFIYPHKNLSVSSYPEWYGDYGDLSLNVSVFLLDDMKGEVKEDAISERDALDDGEFGPAMDFSYGPSENIIEIGDVYVKEYIVFQRFDICDVTFDWHAVFYNEGRQVHITLSADRQNIMDEMAQYFVEDDLNCSNQKTWDIEKMGDFYDLVITGQVEGTARRWQEAIDSIKHLLQINDFKGASAGYSRLIDRRYYEENTDEKYVIDVSYPEFESAVSGGLDETINKIIYEERIQSDIKAFKDEISSYEDEDFLFNYFLGIDYSVLTYDDRLISINIDTYPYLGGAHGMLYFYTYNFDLEKMQLIDLEDIFIQDYDYREFISKYCREDLKKQMQDMGFEPDEDWIADGTDPDYLDTLTNYLITSESIIMKFQAYQVAPYAAGDFSVDIPYSLFYDYIDPESVVYSYID